MLRELGVAAIEPGRASRSRAPDRWPLPGRESHRRLSSVCAKLQVASESAGGRRSLHSPASSDGAKMAAGDTKRGRPKRGAAAPDAAGAWPGGSAA